MNQYFEQMVYSASPVEIVCLLYQRAIRSVREAREHLKSGEIMARSKAIHHAWMVLLELINSLDPSAAPELGNQLQSLYGYMQSRLVEANLKQAEEPLAEVLMLLSTLAEGWEGVTAAEKRRANQAEWGEAEWSQVPLVDGELSRFAVSA